jgi:hypothetical protein
VKNGGNRVCANSNYSSERANVDIYRATAGNVTAEKLRGMSKILNTCLRWGRPFPGKKGFRVKCGMDWDGQGGWLSEAVNAEKRE